MDTPATTPPLPVLDIIEGPEWFDYDETHQRRWEHHAYRLRLTHEGRSVETPWRQGIGITRDPEAHEVIGGLISDAQGIESCTGFTDWAEQYGYDPDSIRARGWYDEARQRYDDLADLLTRRVMVALMDDEDATYGSAEAFARAWSSAFGEVPA